ncbi:MAG TPA: YgiT-type zinc finger protein [bacterium]|nr:YgiT-type zinc finger protein [bacterium]
MKCIHCQGLMKRGKAPFHFDRPGCHVTLDAVPAWICTRCGEAFFEGKEVDALQNLVEAIEQNATAFLCPA